MLRYKLDELNDDWNKIEWRIKWSEYGIDGNRNDTDPGVITSHGWVHLRINGATVINETLPLGNNAQGRIPYFKFGLSWNFLTFRKLKYK